MQYISSKKFDKQFEKLPKKTKKSFFEKMIVFQADPFHPSLNNHSVHYPYDECRSISITGDIRALYETIGDTALFVRIGSHSFLYK